jgi:hypothetical protein
MDTLFGTADHRGLTVKAQTWTSGVGCAASASTDTRWRSDEAHTIDKALTDKRLLGAALGEDTTTWSTWVTALALILVGHFLR